MPNLHGYADDGPPEAAQWEVGGGPASAGKHTNCKREKNKCQY